MADPVINDARLKRISRALTPPTGPEVSTGDPAMDSAVAAGLAGNWTWDDARLVLGPAAESFTRYITYAAREWRDSRRAGQTRTYDIPMWYAIEIGSYQLDEEPPKELAQLLERALVDNSVDPFESETVNGILRATRTEAIIMMLLLGTPDGTAFRHKVWRHET